MSRTYDDMQDITESEIQREVEALKSHRRISVNRPILDPDLPELAPGRSAGRDLLGPDEAVSSSSASSASSGYLGSGTPPKPSWGGGVSLNDEGPMARNDTNGPSTGSLRAARSTFTARRRAAVEARDGTASPQRQPSDPSSSTSNSAPLDPSHLFWVPASMHPEISPSDFRKFLHEHASRAVRDGNERQQAENASPPSSPVSPTTPVALPVELLRNRSTSIARRGSTLRRQYRPEHDNEDDTGLAKTASRIRPLSQRSVGFGAGAPELSIDDLQKLERLAEEASQSSDPSELRSVLRRTMSLSVSPSALDQVDALPQENDQDAPLIPRPGQILRRAARTKIRKSSISGADAPGGPGGSRFGPRRRGTAAPSGSTAGPNTRPQSDELEADQHEGDVSTLASDADDRRQSGTSSEGYTESGLSGHGLPGSSEAANAMRRDSDAATESIVDAYSRHSLVSDETNRSSVTSIAESANKHASSQDDIDASANDPTPKTTAALRVAGASRIAATEGSTESRSPPKKDISKSDAALGRRDIRPIVVQQVAPVPSFEKTRPAPSPPAVPASISAPPSVLTSKPPASAPSSTAAHAVPPAMTAADDASLAHQRPLRSETMPNVSTSAPGPGSTPSPIRGSKEKKSGFGLHWLSNWTKDDESDSKMSKKEKRERKERERQAQQQQAHVERGADEKDKESSGFLGSLFGKKKGHDDAGKGEHGQHIYPHGFPGAHVTAGSLLDMRNKGLTGYYQRYPIHIERAVYRLSHIKLANPRRPLYEQVLISNLMFWYLSVINKTQQPQQQPQNASQQQTQQQREQAQNANAQQAANEAEHRDGMGGLSGNAPSRAGTTAKGAQRSEELQAMPVAVPTEASPMSGVPPSDAEDDVLLRGAPAVLTEAAPPIDDQGSEISESSGMVSTLASTLGKGSLGSNARDKSSSLPPSAKFNSAKPKRTGLVKPNRAPPGARSAERAIPGATYGAQHRRLNSEMAASHTSSSSGNGPSLGDGYIKSLGLNVVSDSRSDAYSASSNAGGMPRASRNASSPNDEHAWLGSQQDKRRSPKGDDARSRSYSVDVAGDGWHVDGDDQYADQAWAGSNGGTRSTKADARHTTGDPLSLHQSIGAHNDATSAMLDAARLSQSRRR